MSVVEIPLSLAMVQFWGAMTIPQVFVFLGKVFVGVGGAAAVCLRSLRDDTRAYFRAVHGSCVCCNALGIKIIVVEYGGHRKVSLHKQAMLIAVRVSTDTTRGRNWQVS